MKVVICQRILKENDRLKESGNLSRQTPSAFHGILKRDLDCMKELETVIANAKTKIIKWNA